jgi:aquaporin Z
MNRNPSNLKEACKSSVLIMVFELCGTAVLAIMFRIFIHLSLVESVTMPDGKTVSVEAPYNASYLYMSFFFGYWLISFVANHITGAHFNPAITIAYLFKRDTNFNRVLVIFYILAQSAGALIGGLLAFLITRTGGALYIKGGEKGEWEFAFQAIVMEAICTFLFALVFLIQQDEKTKFSNDPAKNCLFMSIAYGSFVLLTNPISRGPLNPAIGAAICITEWFNTWNGAALEFIWIYIGAPVGGAILAVIFYETLYKRIVIESDESLTMAENYYYGKKDSKNDK